MYQGCLICNVHCTISHKHSIKKIKRVLHPYGLKYIILILESISEMRDGTLIYVQILGIYWRLSLGYVGTYNDDKIRTIKVLKIGKSRMGSIVAVAWRLPSPTSEIALQTRMYIMDHRASLKIIFLRYLYNIPLRPWCNTFTLRHLNPCFVTSNNICKLSLIEFWKKIDQLLGFLYARLWQDVLWYGSVRRSVRMSTRRTITQECFEQF